MIYAGFWIRFLAVLIDTIVLLFLLVPIMVLIYGVNYNSVELSAQNMSYWTSSFSIEGTENLLLNYLLPALIVLLFWIYKSATPGKMMTKLTIVDAKTGKKPTILQFFLRYAGYFLSSIFLLGFIWVAFDKRKQGWHDKIAGTVVIRDARKQEVRFED